MGREPTTGAASDPSVQYQTGAAVVRGIKSLRWQERQA